MDLDTVTFGFGLQGTLDVGFSTWTLDLNLVFLRIRFGFFLLDIELTRTKIAAATGFCKRKTALSG